MKEKRKKINYNTLKSILEEPKYIWKAYEEKWNWGKAILKK